jgi:hypothetical protein
MWDHVRSVLYWLIAHAQAVVTGLAAIAAMFSALSSWLIWRVQRSNLLESVRPELVLLYWTRENQGDLPTHNARSVISFSAIKNVGRGTAFNIWLRVLHPEYGRYSMGTIRHPILATGEEHVPADARIVVWFKDAETKVVRVPLAVSSRDSRGNEYVTLYDLLVVRADIPFAGGILAENLDTTRTTTMTTARRLRWRASRNRFVLKYGEVPVLGKAITRVVEFTTRWL